MRKSIRHLQVAVVLLGSTLLVRHASAQSFVTSVAPSIGMGVALPHGHRGHIAGAGFTATGGADLTFASFPVLLRPEIAYVRFIDGTGHDTHQVSGSLNLVVPVRRGRISPFVILGAGVYHLARNARAYSDGSLNAGLLHTGGLAENNPGIHAGAGVDFAFGFMRGRLDARYQYVRASPSNITPDTYFPVTLSFRF
jgi:hypothetical protein